MCLEGLFLHVLPHSPHAVCQALIPRIKSMWSECEGVEEWVGQRETVLTECGSIGANLPRLKEQSEILKVHMHSTLFVTVKCNHLCSAG